MGTRGGEVTRGANLLHADVCLSCSKLSSSCRNGRNFLTLTQTTVPMVDLSAGFKLGRDAPICRAPAG